MIDVDGYLAVLGVARPAAPTAEALRALHRAQVERVPYETLDNQLGRPTGIGAAESVARILRGRGGYCFHLNGAFAALLTALGYDVTLHRAGVQDEVEDPGGPGGDHLALTVGLDGERWLVDTGLAGGMYEPLPLREVPTPRGRSPTRWPRRWWCPAAGGSPMTPAAPSRRWSSRRSPWSCPPSLRSTTGCPLPLNPDSSGSSKSSSATPRAWTCCAAVCCAGSTPKARTSGPSTRPTTGTTYWPTCSI